MIEVEEGSGAGIVGFLLLLTLPNLQKNNKNNNNNNNAPITITTNKTTNPTTTLTTTPSPSILSACLRLCRGVALMMWPLRRGRGWSGFDLFLYWGQCGWDDAVGMMRRRQQPWEPTADSDGSGGWTRSVGFGMAITT